MYTEMISPVPGYAKKFRFLDPFRCASRMIEENVKLVIEYVYDVFLSSDPHSFIFYPYNERFVTYF